jgi:NAD(P)-dependent dehydrogenase (short-subunit alcohol dehydrogenase family)
VSRWTPADLPSQQGRTHLVTGANGGLWFQTARMLARAGGRVLLACRDEGRGAAAVERIVAEAPDAELTVVPCDLADQDSVAEAADMVRGLTDRLDSLVCNAGVMATPPRLTVDGFELQLATNHLGHHALVGRLLDLVLAASAGRVVTVSSIAARRGRIALDDLNRTRSYDPWGAYAQTKLANLMFALELQRRFEAAGAPAAALAAHPGYSDTGLQEVGPQMSGSAIGKVAMKVGNVLFGQSEEAGAVPQVFAAAAPEARPGGYYGPSGPGEVWGRHPTEARVVAQARDAQVAARLFELSAEMTGVTVDPRS